MNFLEKIVAEGATLDNTDTVLHFGNIEEEMQALLGRAGIAWLQGTSHFLHPPR